MIKISVENEIAIEQALKSVNGKAQAHTFTHWIDIQRIADEAETKLDKLGIPQAMRKGALYVANSGETLPSAYKYAATVTSATIERRSSGWYIRDLALGDRYPREKPRRALYLTRGQDEKVIANIRKLYHVIDA